MKQFVKVFRLLTTLLGLIFFALPIHAASRIKITLWHAMAGSLGETVKQISD